MNVESGNKHILHGDTGEHTSNTSTENNPFHIIF